MALPAVEFTVQDENGDIIADPNVTVRIESTGSLASLFSDRDGSNGLANPFDASVLGLADGKVRFFVAGAALRIDVSSGAFSDTFRYKAAGLLGEKDAVAAADIGSNAVTTAKIADENVTTAKIADDAVTQAKLGSDVNKASQAKMEAASEDSVDAIATAGNMNWHPGVAKVIGSVNILGGVASLEAGSHNVSSLTDAGVGIYGITIATDFSGTDYVALATTLQLDGSGFIGHAGISDRAAGTFNVRCTSAADAVTAADLETAFAAWGDQ